MPNHVENIITLSGNKQEIRRMLEQIKSDELCVGTVDFNKIITIPESLNIEAAAELTGAEDCSFCRSSLPPKTTLIFAVASILLLFDE